MPHPAEAARTVAMRAPGTTTSAELRKAWPSPPIDQASARLPNVNPPPMPAGSVANSACGRRATRITQSSGPTTATMAIPTTTRATIRVVRPIITTLLIVARSSSRPLRIPAEHSAELLDGEHDQHQHHGDECDGGAPPELVALVQRHVDGVVERRRRHAGPAIGEAVDPRKEAGDRADREQHRPEPGDRAQRRPVDVVDDAQESGTVEGGRFGVRRRQRGES